MGEAHPVGFTLGQPGRATVTALAYSKPYALDLAHLPLCRLLEETTRMNTKDTTKNSPWELPESEPVATTKPKLSDKAGTVHAILLDTARDMRETAKALEAIVQAVDEMAADPEHHEVDQVGQEKAAAMLGGMILMGSSARNVAERIRARICEIDPEGMRLASEALEARRRRG